VAAVFGLHNAPELPTGTFATRAGPFYANVDRFQILITGKGAHAAKPEQGVDTIVTASQIVTALQTLPSRSFTVRWNRWWSASRVSRAAIPGTFCRRP
jgi:metal-dependent amidase/aminoacylase/carboxypeptidase family protein